MTSNRNFFSLQNKVIFLAGAAGLIGKESARAIAESGGFPVMIDLPESNLENISVELKSEGLNVAMKHCNISDPESTSQTFIEATEEYGCPHGWVNCSYPRTEDWSSCTFESASFESARENIELHLTSAIWSSNLIAKLMKENQVNGSIVNFGSIYGIVGQDPQLYFGTNIRPNLLYSAIKSGISGFSRQLAAEYGRFGIRANCISPGGVFDNHATSFVENYRKKVPLNRMALSSDIAPSVVFLLSDASSYITGVNLPVDGGWTCI